MKTEQPLLLRFDATRNYGPLYVRLAWQCFNTFRQTDYQGGCNGARIRHAPQIGWPANADLNHAIELLRPIKDNYKDSLSWADLIVLSGTTALEYAASQARVNLSIPFVGGRSDADANEPAVVNPSYLQLRVQGGQSQDNSHLMRDVATVMGLTDREFVALVGGGHGLGRLHSSRSGFVDGAWTSTPGQLSNNYFVSLLNLTWAQTISSDPHIHYTSTSSGHSVYMLKSDMQFLFDPIYQAIVQEYAQDSTVFYNEFAAAWYKIMTADTYSIDTTIPSDASSSSSSDDGLSKEAIIGIAVGAGAAVPILGALGWYAYSANQATSGVGSFNQGVEVKNPSHSGFR
jgi:catalase (peroxidase I)